MGTRKEKHSVKGFIGLGAFEIGGFAYRYKYIDNISDHNLLLLHGGELDIDMWYPFVSENRFSSNVLMVQFPEAIDDADKLVEDLVVLLKNLNVHKSIVVGFAFGGLVAVSLCLQYPSLIERLIISNCTFDNRQLQTATKRLNILKLFPENFFRFLIRKKGIMNSKTGPWSEWSSRYEDYIINSYISKRLMISRINMINGLFEKFQNIHLDVKMNQPVMLVSSKNDPTNHGDLTDDKNLLSSYFTRIDTYVFDTGCGGHHLPIFSPRKFYDVVLGGSL